jgi:hypothetical protein
MRTQALESLNDFDVAGHVDDLVAFFARLGLSECQMFEVLEVMMLDALGASATKH